MGLLFRSPGESARAAMVKLRMRHEHASPYEDRGFAALVSRRCDGASLQPTEETDRGEPFKTHPVDLKNAADVLVMSQPQMIREIHRQYLDAGADIIGPTKIMLSFNADKLRRASKPSVARSLAGRRGRFQTSEAAEPASLAPPVRGSIRARQTHSRGHGIA